MIDILLEYGGERCYLCGSTDLAVDEDEYSCNDCIAEYDMTVDGDVVLYGDQYHLVISPVYSEIPILYYISVIRSQNGVEFE